MNYHHSSIAMAAGFIWLALLIPRFVSAQTTPQSISFNSFNATYHLSRDAANHSLLTTEEVILADFPGTASYYGITRAIPQQYQGRSVQVKVLNVADAAGSPVPFKTSPDKQGNLVVTTGDPKITLYGIQTFQINYQTRDVVNTKLATDQFLLDVNGRGWDQSFPQVSGVIHIPKSFASSLIGKPSCYIGYLQTTTTNCLITTKTTVSETVITTKSTGSVAAHHGLVAKINFRTATFSVKQNFWLRWKGGLITLAATAIVIGTWYVLARRII